MLLVDMVRGLQIWLTQILWLGTPYVL